MTPAGRTHTTRRQACIQAHSIGHTAGPGPQFCPRFCLPLIVSQTLQGYHHSHNTTGRQSTLRIDKISRFQRIYNSRTKSWKHLTTCLQKKAMMFSGSDPVNPVLSNYFCFWNLEKVMMHGFPDGSVAKTPSRACWIQGNRWLTHSCLIKDHAAGNELT